MTDTRGNPRPVNELDIVAHFRDWPMEDSLRQYLDYHAERYAYLMKKIDGLEHTRILDIGISFQTALMREAYPDSVVDTFGFGDLRFAPRACDRHIYYDLNYSGHLETWMAPEAPYDLVVMAEVIEHLYTAARPVLTCVASYLRPGGALILQTPNAVSLGRRTAVLRGKNPYSMIREDRANSGHFCEFTLGELKTAVESAGMRVEDADVTNYFGKRGLRRSVYKTLCGLLPGELRDGITLIARKP